jgi:hypothetical protein
MVQRRQRVGTPPAAEPVQYVYNNLLLSDPSDRPFPAPSVVVGADYVFRGNGLDFEHNDYYPSPPPRVISDNAVIPIDPQLGFETNPGATDPAQLFELNYMAPQSIREDGLDLVRKLGSEWWTPNDPTNPMDTYWRDTFMKMRLPAQDFFGNSVPNRRGNFSIGASQSIN